MNYRLVFRVLGLFTGATALSMTAALAWSLADGTPDRLPLVWGIGVGLAIGAVLWVPNRRATGEIYRREGFAVVTLSWVLAAFVGAIPFYLYPGEAFPTFLDAYFEAMSGFTTTGASVLTDIEALPRGILFWRSLTHWLGGMGIIVLFVAVLPFLGVGGRQLFRSEVAGIEKSGLTPRIHATARRLWLIYLGITVLGVVLLRVLGLNTFQAMCETFGALATGGFSVRNASIGGYGSIPVEAVLILLMVLGGANFALYYRLLEGRGKHVLADRELHAYLGLLVVFVLVLTAVLVGSGTVANAGTALRRAAFNGVSMMTCTGFATTDTNQWPDAGRFLLVVMMGIGGSAGSTAGGMKVVRVVILAKMAYLGIYKALRPNEVRSLYLGGKVVPEQVQHAIMVFTIVGIVVFLVASFILVAVGVDVVTSVSAVVANLCTAGPGLGEVGSAGNYSGLPALAKLTLVACELLGRLEFMTVLVFLVPSFWDRRAIRVGRPQAEDLA